MTHSTSGGAQTPTNRSGSGKLWIRIVSLITVFIIFASIALVREGKLWGVDFNPAPPVSVATADTIATLPNGTTVVNTSLLDIPVQGYAGPVGVKIHISSGRIDSISPLPNSETPGFFRRVMDSPIPHAWDGKTLEEASAVHPDAVSGATFSSKALIANIEGGLAYYSQHKGKDAAGSWWDTPDLKSVAALAVLLLACIVPFYSTKRSWRLVQELLNVGVLGFWAGTFLDYTMMIKVAAGGLSFDFASFITVILLIAGFIYPLLGKPGHYCAWVCPLGSAQALAGRLGKGHQLHIGKRTSRALSLFREVLFGILLFLLWLGWGWQWIDYELFSAFIVRSAAWSVIGVGIAVIILSVFIPRPFCRFICPLGTILRKCDDVTAP